jgi:hypothetical protein
MKTLCVLTIGVALATVGGCSGPVAKERRAQQPDPVVDMLHRGVIELNGNIDELQRHIAHLQQMPPISDPRVQELRGLDLASWQLHLQQWVVQRDHLVSSLGLIQRVKAAPPDKSAIGGEWSDRQATFVKTMEELKSNRQKIEQKRIEVESQVLQQYFR